MTESLLLAAVMLALAALALPEAREGFEGQRKLGFYNEPPRPQGWLLEAYASAEDLRTAFAAGTVQGAVDQDDPMLAAGARSRTPAAPVHVVALCTNGARAPFTGLRVGVSPEDRDAAAAVLKALGSSPADLKLLGQAAYLKAADCVDVYITNVPPSSSFLASLPHRFYMEDLPSTGSGLLAGTYPAGAVDHAYNLRAVTSLLKPRYLYLR